MQTPVKTAGSWIVPTVMPTDRHMYRELAKMTQIPQLRMVYAKMHARAYRREKEIAAVQPATV